MPNRRIAEYFITAIAIGLGTPVLAILGAQQGERDAAEAYPVVAAVEHEGPKDFSRHILASVESEERGRDLFARNCVACHGAEADGKGPGAAGLTPPPRNFLDPRARWTRGRGPLELYAAVSEGSPGTAMPGFAAALPVPDRWALVHYLASLPGVKPQYSPMDAVAAAAWRP